MRRCKYKFCQKYFRYKKKDIKYCSTNCANKARGLRMYLDKEKKRKKRMDYLKYIDENHWIEIGLSSSYEAMKEIYEMFKPKVSDTNKYKLIRRYLINTIN